MDCVWIILPRIRLKDVPCAIKFYNGWVRKILESSNGLVARDGVPWVVMVWLERVPIVSIVINTTSSEIVRVTKITARVPSVPDSALSFRDQVRAKNPFPLSPSSRSAGGVLMAPPSRPGLPDT